MGAIRTLPASASNLSGWRPACDERTQGAHPPWRDSCFGRVGWHVGDVADPGDAFASSSLEAEKQIRSLRPLTGMPAGLMIRSVSQ